MSQVNLNQIHVLLTETDINKLLELLKKEGDGLSEMLADYLELQLLMLHQSQISEVDLDEVPF